MSYTNWADGAPTGSLDFGVILPFTEEWFYNRRNAAFGALLEFDSAPNLAAIQAAIDVDGMHVIAGNTAGLNLNRSSVLANDRDGIHLLFTPSVDVRQNVVGGNLENGVSVNSGTDVMIIGNTIGTNAANVQLGNASGGIIIDQTTGVVIGGTGATDANTIANNQDGVVVTGGAARVTIDGNSIYSNTALGIDLNADGPTPNDDGDSDFGPNRRQNTPVIDSVTSSSQTTITGTVNSTANTNLTLQFFSNDNAVAADAEGEQFVGELDVTTDSNGDFSFEFALPGGPIPAGRFVTSTATGPDGTSEFSAAVEVSTTVATFVVTNTSDSGPGSLRQAILDANAATAPAMIAFQIPSSDGGFIDVDNGSGLTGEDADDDVFRISPATNLPALNNVNGQPITLNATTQHSLTGDTNPNGPEIELDGSNLSGGAVGLWLGSNVTVRGLNVHSFPTVGIFAPGPATNVHVAGNYVGTDPTGRIAMPNRGIAGVSFSGATNSVLGGPNLEDRNIISGNAVHGVELAAASDITLQNNYVGTDPNGTMAVPNGQGVQIVNSSNVFLGAGGVGNVVSGNTNGGVWVSANSNAVSIQNNYIGTDASGTDDVGNGGDGILSFSGATNLTIGGGESRRNIISGNDNMGIRTQGGTTNVTIQGNYVGLNAAGTEAIPNGVHGIEISSTTNATIGGSTAGTGNVLSGNTRDGLVAFSSNGVTVLGNKLGTSADGRFAVPNLEDGIDMFAADNLVIGGSGSGEGNLISGNGGPRDQPVQRGHGQRDREPDWNRSRRNAAVAQRRHGLERVSG